MNTDGINRFDDSFYVERRQIVNADRLDNRLPDVNPMNSHALRVLDAKVTLGHSQGMAERDWHMLAMKHHERQLDLDGPRALAGREEALHPVIVNAASGKTEARVIQLMNDRLALAQEIGTSLVTRTQNEIDLYKTLEQRGVLWGSPPDDEDDDDEEVV
jgi:hypothetical protein